MRRAVVIFSLAILSAGCRRELDRESATQILGTHLLSFAPQSGVPLDSIHAAQILQPDENTREARFVMRMNQDSVIASAFFQRSDEGWALSRYGNGMDEIVSSFVVRQWIHDFEDLYTAADSLRSLARAWASPVEQQSLAALKAGRLAEYSHLAEMVELGPAADEFRSFVNRVGVPSGSAVWRYEPAPYRKTTGAITVERADGSAHCGVKFGASSADPPPQYYWVGDLLPKCGKAGAEKDFLEVADDAKKQAAEGLLSEAY